MATTKTDSKVPLMITKEQVKKLQDLGYTEDDINFMKPKDAHQYIENGVFKSPAPKKETKPDQPVDKKPTGEYNPLDDSVIEKSYTSGPVSGGQPLNVDIPEPSFTPPPHEAGETTPTPESFESEGSKKKESKPAGNPDLDGASQNEKDAGAAAMASFIFSMWGKGYKAINELAKFSDKKIAKEQRAGRIDTSVLVPHQMGLQPLSRVLQDFNKDADELLVMEPEFVEEMHPLLTEELKKAGHGLSNRQQLILGILLKVGNDAQKVVSFLMLKRDYLRFAREETAMMRAGKGQPAQSPAPPPVAQPPIQAEENYEEPVIEPQRMTLQEEAINKLAPAGVNNTASFGKRKTLSVIEKGSKADRVDTKRKKTTPDARIKKAKEQVQSIGPVPTAEKKGPGRPKGAKNKPKK